jgi:hypothetical protein
LILATVSHGEDSLLPTRCEVTDVIELGAVANNGINSGGLEYRSVGGVFPTLELYLDSRESSRLVSEGSLISWLVKLTTTVFSQCGTNIRFALIAKSSYLLVESIHVE